MKLILISDWMDCNESKGIVEINLHCSPLELTKLQDLIHFNWRESVEIRWTVKEKSEKTKSPPALVVHTKLAPKQQHTVQTSVHESTPNCTKYAMDVTRVHKACLCFSSIQSIFKNLKSQGAWNEWSRRMIELLQITETLLSGGSKIWVDDHSVPPGFDLWWWWSESKVLTIIPWEIWVRKSIFEKWEYQVVKNY